MPVPMPPRQRMRRTLFNEGFNLVLNGKAEQGLQMMENALRQGIAGRRPDHARLCSSLMPTTSEARTRRRCRSSARSRARMAPLPWLVRGPSAWPALREADGRRSPGASGALPRFRWRRMGPRLVDRAQARRALVPRIE